MEGSSALFSDILGHEPIKRGLMHALQSGRVHHALMFLGRSGIGKSMLAKAFAQVLFCEHSSAESGDWQRCTQCRQCRRVSQGNHPDFWEISTQTSSITIESIRELQQRVAYQPYEAARRVVVIHEAHLMQIPAANALLKTLEEPATRTTFILITDQEQRILPTILSRCQILRFAPFSNHEIELVLCQRGISPDRAQIVAALSFGSLGAALQLLEGSYSDRILERFYEILALKQPLDCFALADAVSKDKEVHEPVLLLLLAFLRDLMLIKTHDDAALSLEHQREALILCAQHAQVKHIHRCIRLVDEIHEALLGNANALLAFERMFLGLHHVFF